MFHGHSYYLARFRAIGDELDGFSFRLGVLDELFESSSLDEEFNSVLQVYAIVCYVPMALEEPIVLCFFDFLSLL